MLRATAIISASEFSEVPEITQIDYDLWTLRITLRFPNKRAPFYVEFRNITGFRVLDEGQLIEFWEKSHRPEGCLWKIDSGGWFELESSREGFLLDDIGASNKPSEYFIVGLNDCINVFSNHEPNIYCAKP